MMSDLRRPTRTILVPLALLALAVPACDDPTEIDEHVAAEGFAIVEAATETELYRYMLTDGAPTELTLAVGAHDVAFVLLDHDGNPIPHEEGSGEEEELVITIGDTSILTWTPEAEVPGEVHTIEEFHGELNALQSGSTTMAVCLVHAGHCDFETPENTPVPVTVTP